MKQFKPRLTDNKNTDDEAIQIGEINNEPVILNEYEQFQNKNNMLNNVNENIENGNQHETRN